MSLIRKLLFDLPDLINYKLNVFFFFFIFFPPFWWLIMVSMILDIVTWVMWVVGHGGRPQQSQQIDELNYNLLFNEI